LTLSAPADFVAASSVFRAECCLPIFVLEARSAKTTAERPMLNRLPSGVDALVSGGSAERVGSCFPVSAPAARSAELAAERLMFSLPASEADALVAGPWAERVMLGLSVSALRVWDSAIATLEAVSDKATAPAATIAAVCLASFVDILLSEAWMKRCSCSRLNPPLHVNCKAVAARGPSIFGPSSVFSR
jgi:hypothetical protein